MPSRDVRLTWFLERDLNKVERLLLLRDDEVS